MDIPSSLGNGDFFSYLQSFAVTKVKAWEKVFNTRPILRTNPAFLRAFSDLFENLPIKKHLFNGEIIGNTFKGMHYHGAIDGDLIRAVGNASDFYPDGSIKRIKIEMKLPNNTYTSPKWKTLFHKDWSQDKIIEEIAFVRSKAEYATSNPRIFEGLSSDGVTNIRVELTGQDLNALQLQYSIPFLNN